MSGCGQVEEGSEVEIEAACDHGRGRLVEERLLGEETTEEEGWAHQYCETRCMSL